MSLWALGKMSPFSEIKLTKTMNRLTKKNTLQMTNKEPKSLAESHLVTQMWEKWLCDRRSLVVIHKQSVRKHDGVR